MDVISKLLQLLVVAALTSFFGLCEYRMGLNQNGYPWENLRNKLGQVIDRRKLLELYALICPPDAVCGETNYYGYDIDVAPKGKKGRIFRACKWCLCDESCLTMNSCCPDLTAAYMKHDCVDTGLYRHSHSPIFPTLEEIQDARENPALHDNMTMHEYISTMMQIFEDTNTWNLMITSCPEDASSDDILLCNSGKSLPVSGNTSRISYRNKHCARCNYDDNDLIDWGVSFYCNEAFEENSWEHTSLQKLERELEENSCTVKLDPQPTHSNSDLRRPISYKCNYLRTYGYKIERCNVTGLWAHYDPDIEWACENLNLAFKWHYKNVFCFICNPSISSVKSKVVYDQCNMTGLWEDYHEPYETYCLALPSIERLAPFKNAYCMMCNGYDKIYRNEMPDDYGLAYIDEPYLKETDPTPTIEIYLQMTGDNLVEQCREAFKLIAPNFHYFAYEVNHRGLRQTSEEENVLLFEAYLQTCGRIRLCKNYSLPTAGDSTGYSVPEICQNCECHNSCIVNDDCCIDFILERQPYTCIEDPYVITIENSIADFKRDEGRSISVIDTCMNKADADLVRRCETEHFDRSDILQYIPVFDGADYKNIYCLMCNNNESKPNFKLEVTCPAYFETGLIKTFVDLLELTGKYCKVKVPAVNFNRYHCDPETDEYLISSCNETGLWLEYDRLISDGCEGKSAATFLPVFSFRHNTTGTVHYKNYLCFLCNPRATPSTVREIYDRCNATERWHSYNANLEKSCRETVLVQSWLPYKNVFCYMCNENVLGGTYKDPPRRLWTLRGNTMPWMDMPMMDAGLGYTYKMMFSVTPEEWRRLYPNTNEPLANRCEIGYSYDYSTKSCRLVYCSEDRVLVDDECVPMSHLIPTSEGTLSVEAMLNDLHIPIYMYYSTDSRDLVMDFFTGEGYVAINFLSDKMIYKMKNALNKKGYKMAVKHMHLLVTKDCAEKEDVLAIQTIAARHPMVKVPYYVDGSFKIYINFEVAYYDVNQTMVIELLRKIFKDPVGLIVQSAEFWFNVSIEDTLINITAIRLAGNVCEDERSLQLAHQGLGFKATKEPPVTPKIESCTQIELHEDEFVINTTTQEVSIHEGKIVLKDGEFIMIDNSTVRVCLSDFEIKPTQSLVGTSTFYKAHNIFSYTFTMISLFCLLVTFITYCMFPEVRTIPGKNIMNLCVCLFVAQGSLQFSSFLPVTDSTCVPFAILTHYSWLATFCAMNACSFHMYWLFYNKAMMSTQTLNRFSLTKLYLIYTYSVPFIVIALTLAIHLGLSNGEFTGYGKFVCFLSDIYTIIFTFIVPAAIILIANIAFFAAAFQAIRTSPRIACSTRDRHEFFIYLKLCALTGISWPLQIIDSFLPLTVFSYIAVFVNASQGFYIFISYVCNKRIWKLLLKMLTGNIHPYMGESMYSSKLGVYYTKSADGTNRLESVRE